MDDIKLYAGVNELPPPTVWYVPPTERSSETIQRKAAGYMVLAVKAYREHHNKGAVHNIQKHL